MNYGPDHDPMENLRNGDAATLVYARGRDYRDVLKGDLNRSHPVSPQGKGWRSRYLSRYGATDGKAAGARAGLGWQGKYTNLVSRSSLMAFSGVILTAADWAGRQCR